MIKTHISLRLFLPILVLLTMAGTAIAQCGQCGPDEQFCPSPSDSCRCIPARNLCLLEPVPGGDDQIAPGGSALAPFFSYVNNGVWQWAFGMGVAIAVLNAVVGGFQIVLSNGDSGKVDAGKTRFISSAIGLIMLLLSGVILEFINPIGFSST